MPKLMPTVLLIGLLAGFLVGGFHNLFTVPVLERAIADEERRAAAAVAAGAVQEEGGAEVSLGVQRIGLAVGSGIYGAIMGLVFAGGFLLVRRIAPQWHPMALALIVGALGFWSLSLFPFIRYPVNPPGVGDPGTLLFRQGFQTLFFVLSAAGVAGALVAIKKLNLSISDFRQQTQLWAAVLLSYAVYALVIVFALPANPDPVPAPVDLVALFRALTMVGQFLQWMLLALGVGLFIMWRQRQALIGGDAASPELAHRVSSS